MTWLELYTFLLDSANNSKKFEDMSKFWNQKVYVYNLSNGIKSPCDTLIIDEEELVLSTSDENNE